MSAECLRALALRRHGCQAGEHRFCLGVALRALNESTAEYAGVVAIVGIEHAGLSGRDAALTVDQFDPGHAIATMENRRARRARGANLGEDFNAFRCSCDKRFVAQPVEVAQENLVRLQSLSRSDNDAGALSVEVDNIKRFA